MSSPSTSRTDFFDTLVSVTESFLTWKRQRRLKRRQKQKQKNWVVDWVEAFVWAACVVLLINQYFFQAYEIPSGSMEKTLLVHDRIFVNKFIYGPELLPGLGKLPGLTNPKRGDIIIFENPSYISPVYSWGPAWVTAYDIAQRLLYMMTLSLVDIDKNPDGTPKAHFLVKRAVGYSGDIVRFRDGNAWFQPAGTQKWYSENELKKWTGLEYGNHRVSQDIQNRYYSLLRRYAKVVAYQSIGLPIDKADQGVVDQYNAFMRDAMENKASFIYDPFELDRLEARTEMEFYPDVPEVVSSWQKSENGTYIPLGYILPLGDNRDNSKDGRYFGPVPEAKILGQAAFRYWPIARLGVIK
ncbi:MAG: signal peptidase I [Spirochaetales bacterium]|nr:signal peptidase I [Spirochaetales bacterium]